jgi:hypothetical protein
VGLGAEKYIQAAADLWALAQFCDVARDVNDGPVMQDALGALGQIGARDFLVNITLRLDDLNTHETSDVETRRRLQRGAAGAINALEALREPDGYRPVFFASIGWYDPAIRRIAYDALPNIVDDPADIIIGIINNPSSIPEIKDTALQEMLRTLAPDASKAKVAAAALATGWTYSTNDSHNQRVLREMRMSAIDTIRLLGVGDNSVYANLEKSYNNNFVSAMPYYDEIRKTLETLSVIKTDEAVELLLKFLRELHARRRDGPWGNKERQALQWLIPALGATKTQSQDAALLLTTIQSSGDYTGAEQIWARDALREISR